MMREVLSRFDQPIFPISALFIFAICFVIYVFWTLKKENKKFYDRSSYMPLNDGVKHER